MIGNGIEMLTAVPRVRHTQEQNYLVDNGPHAMVAGSGCSAPPFPGPFVSAKSHAASQQQCDFNLKTALPTRSYSSLRVHPQTSLYDKSAHTTFGIDDPPPFIAEYRCRTQKADPKFILARLSQSAQSHQVTFSHPPPLILRSRFSGRSAGGRAVGQ